MPGAFSLSAEMKKAPAIFKIENGKCLLEFHILFFLFRSFLLLCLLLLFLLVLQSLCDRVLWLWLLLGFSLFRHEDFAASVVNIFPLVSDEPLEFALYQL